MDLDLRAFSKLTPKRVIQELHTTAKGLSSQAAAARLKTSGLNRVERESASFFKLLLKQFSSPFVYLLLASVALSFGFQDFVEAWMIAAFIVVNGFLGFYQEYRAERAVALLQAILRPSCTVFRDGRVHRLPSEEVVPGDLCLVEVGDIIPADGVALEVEACLCDEAVLTGESFPVTKQTMNSLSAGTKITQGWAKLLVVATGRNTGLGKIAKLTTQTTGESTYQKSIRRLSVAILWFVVIAVIGTFFLHILFPGQSQVDWVQFAIFSVALAVSVVPETLPLVVTICLSRGALLMARKQVVVKRLSAIEDLGSIEILCTDKTGTLTQNSMHIAEVRAIGEADPCHRALQTIPTEHLKDMASLDPFQQALWRETSKDDRLALAKHVIKAHLPFDPERKRVTTLIQEGDQRRIIACGAAETVFLCCKTVDPALKAWIARQGQLGRRVLVLASRVVNSLEAGMKAVDLENEEHDLELVGGIAFEDPLKATATSALAQILSLGVEVKMLTGDAPDVAAAIAKRVGLIDKKGLVLTGEAFMKFSPAQRRIQAKRCHVFARVNPEQKYAIIKELQRRGTVGFLGEGINDAPALKLADVGIAVHEASDIAREAADVILLDKGLDVIAEGMTEGRRVFANIGKYIRATLVSNFGNFFTMVISLFLIPTLPMLPIQILLLNLLSDFPMTAICVDRVEDEDIRKPVGFPTRSLLIFCAVLGTVSTVFDLIFFFVYRHLAPAHLQVMWFLASVLTELVVLFSLRASRWFFQAAAPPKALWMTSFGAALAAILVTFTHPLMDWFAFLRPTTSLLVMTFVLVGVYFLLTDLLKRLYYHFVRPSWVPSR